MAILMSLEKMKIKIDYQKYKNKNKQIEVLKNRIMSITLNRGFLEKLNKEQEEEIKSIEEEITKLKEVLLR